MIYELFLEGELADIRQDLGMQLNFNIDDINNYGSRDTSFSKTIVLPGTAKNNKLLGFTGELGSYNTYGPGAANINANFNPAQTTKAELRANGLLLMKGVFRLTGIIKDRDMIEYEGSLFGELGGFIASIIGGKLEDLDFKTYNHDYTRNNIVNSWDGRLRKDVNGYFNNRSILDEIGVYGYRLSLAPGSSITISNAGDASNNGTYTVLGAIYNESLGLTAITVMGLGADDTDDNFTIEYSSSAGFGSGYYYPLIDYGTYSDQKLNYDYRTFRPALFVKEYIDKIFEPSGYTYESNFLNSSFFKKLIIPSNSKDLKGLFSDLLNSNSNKTSIVSPTTQTINITFSNENLKRSFTGNGNPNYTYTGSNERLNIKYSITGYLIGAPILFTNVRSNAEVRIRFYKNSTIIKEHFYTSTLGSNININESIDLDFLTNDTITFEVRYDDTGKESYVQATSLQINALNPISTDTLLNDYILMKDAIPKNILQKDFFTWIVKMFNLYITEDKVKQNHLIIEPYKDYYDLNDSIDWTYKVARDKPWQIKPMGMLASRFFEYKYKDDTDFYNEGYKKKYNEPYGTNLQDTGFQFAKQKQSVEIGFSPSVLVEYTGKDKVVSALYKKSRGNSVDQEERMDTNIRIMMIKKITGVASWNIVDTGANQVFPGTNLGAALTSYGYAGHFDDPVNPTVDINFGAAKEIYCAPNVYPSNNLFNTYWSGYIAEIADKDSKLLTCHVYLTDLDIAQLDFSKPVFIDGVLWRINKIIDFDASSGELTKVELLKVINNG